MSPAQTEIVAELHRLGIEFKADTAPDGRSLSISFPAGAMNAVVDDALSVIHAVMARHGSARKGERVEPTKAAARGTPAGAPPAQGIAPGCEARWGAPHAASAGNRPLSRDPRASVDTRGTRRHPATGVRELRSFIEAGRTEGERMAAERQAR